MIDPSSMLTPADLPAIPDATFSVELAAGNTLSPLPAGSQLDLFGQDPVPASRSRQRANVKAKKTSGISGPTSSASSASQSLTTCLGNKLLDLMDTDGSMEYELTWSRPAMPSGLRFFLLRASARPTCDTGSSGVQADLPQASPRATPAARDRRDGRASKETMDRNSRPLNEQVVGWTSPTAQDHSRGGLPPRETDTGCPLSQMVAGLAGWISPRATDLGRQRSEEAIARAKEHGGAAALEDQVRLVGWPTCRTTDVRQTKGNGKLTATGGVQRATGENFSLALPDVAQLAGWPTTPTAPNGGRNGMRTEEGREGEIRHLESMPKILGPTSSSSPAGMERSVASVLNPAMSRWLMGFPPGSEIPGWDTCSPGWSSWAMIQRLLAEYSVGPAETASAGCAATATP